MSKELIRQAILLYEYSGTVKGYFGPVGTLPHRIVPRMWDLYNRNEIGILDLGNASKRGTWRGGRAGADLRINKKYLENLPEKNRLAALSMVLVHEAAHAVLPYPRMLDELAARQITVYYYRELSGPGVFNEAAEIPGSTRRRSLNVQLPPNFGSYGKQSKYLRKGQLIDHMLSIKTYRQRREFNADWVIAHISHWGGPSNRWSSTRGRYIRKLANKVGSYYTAHILDIMESVKTRNQWNRMMRKSGKLRRIQIALEDLGAENQYAARINALQDKWDVTLTEIGAILK